MSVILVLLAASLSVALLFLGAFLWGVRHRQFDDDYSPPVRILFDDAPVGDQVCAPSAEPDAALLSNPNPTNQ
ncbi:MAG TPA: cbb3-type cytochrome oxidase assembly protein CcoS [Puia sp.]|nr:cbb3-type cytochrome oxidase assembly protein CcoS [Puia sp.]